MVPLSPCGPSLILGVELVLDAFFLLTRPFGEGPTVRIRFPPAESQQTFGSAHDFREGPSRRALKLAPIGSGDGEVSRWVRPSCWGENKGTKRRYSGFGWPLLSN